MKHLFAFALLSMTMVAPANAEIRGLTVGRVQNGKKFKIPLAYSADADKKSWAEMKAFFKDFF